MSPPSTCGCLLCQIESHLLSDLTSNEESAYRALIASSESLQQFSSASLLLSHLKASQADARSDQLLRELFEFQACDRKTVESLLLLAFLPMMHRTIRRVVKQQPGLSPDDITQQALSLFLHFLVSSELQGRKSHLAFAISRTVKRRLFEWASREATASRARIDGHSETLGTLTVEEPFERYAFLRHFLHRCVTKGLLAAGELDLLIQFKLDGNDGREVSEAVGPTSNAVRQRMKRLLAKLRRLARSKENRSKFPQGGSGVRFRA